MRWALYFFAENEPDPDKKLRVGRSLRSSAMKFEANLDAIRFEACCKGI
jgi:hypothetical protein